LWYLDFCQSVVNHGRVLATTHKAKGELRSQFHHVIDIAPTVLEAIGLPQPNEMNGIPQRPIQNVSMLYTFDNAAAPSRHKTQYFEIGGNTAIYHDGWLAGTIHRAPREHQPRARLINDKWSCTTSATTLAPGAAAANPNGRPLFAYSWLGVSRNPIASSQKLGPGKHRITVDFSYDGGKLGAGGTVKLEIAGTTLGQGRIDRTIPMTFSADEGADVGIDEGTPVVEDYTTEDSRIHRQYRQGHHLSPAVRRERQRQGRRAARQFIEDKSVED
jgi:hypothetical protein